MNLSLPSVRAAAPRPVQPAGLLGYAGAVGDAAALGSGLIASGVGFAEFLPPGSVILGPGKLQRSPSWTRHFHDGAPMSTVQPYLAAVAAGLTGLVGVAELVRGASTGNTLMKWAGAIDVATGVACAASLLAPGVGGPATLALTGLRFLVALHG